MRIAFLLVVALVVFTTVEIHRTSAVNHKVSVCHMTHSDNNPIVILSVSEQSVPAHLEHGDTLLSSDGTCDILPVFSCTGALPDNASVYPGDTTGLTEDTPYTFSETDTAAKCEYTVVNPS